MTAHIVAVLPHNLMTRLVKGDMGQPMREVMKLTVPFFAMTLMRMRANFPLHMKPLQGVAANDNNEGEPEFVASNLATTELTATLAMLAHDEGVT